MKDKEKIMEMYRFIAFFNDRRFMNQDYREGILEALAFVLYDNQKGSLETIFDEFKK